MLKKKEGINTEILCDGRLYFDRQWPEKVVLRNAESVNRTRYLEDNQGNWLCLSVAGQEQNLLFVGSLW